MNESSFLSFFAKCGKAVMQGSLDYNHLQDRKRRWLKSFWAKAIAFFFFLGGYGVITAFLYSIKKLSLLAVPGMQQW